MSSPADDFTTPTFKVSERTEVYSGVPGRPIRVEVSTSPNGRSFGNIRQWIYADAYPVKVPMAKAGKRQRMDQAAFLTKYGPEGCPDGWHGLPSLEPSALYELAEACVRVAMALESMEEVHDVAV